MTRAARARRRLQALPLIVKGLRAHGLEPVTLDQLYRGARLNAA